MSTLQIFVASPGDVVEERRLVIETIREFEGSFPWRNRDRLPAGMTRGDRTPLASSAGSALIDESPAGNEKGLPRRAAGDARAHGFDGTSALGSA
jgi:hypothetical protein